MSNDTFNDDFDDGRAAKPGMSTGVKVLIGILAGGGLLTVLCCGGVFFFGWSVAKQVELKTTPEAVREIGSKIAGIDIPAEYAPQAGLKMELFGVVMAIATYSNADGDAGVVLMESKFPEQPGQQGQMEMQLEQQFQEIENMYQQQSLGKFYSREKLSDTESTSRELTVRGAPVQFQFTKGKGMVSGQEMREVAGSFPSKGGRVKIIVQMPEEDYNEEEVVKMIESIK